MNNNFKNLLLVILITFSASNCGREKDNFDIDISKLNLPKNVVEPKLKKSEIKPDKDSKIYELKSSTTKDEVISNIKYGKKDPFGFETNSGNNLILNLSLKGIISTSDKKYALIKYLGEEGTITENSIGGINTKYLPKGAKVKKFNLTDSQIIILLNGEEFIISTDSQNK